MFRCASGPAAVALALVALAPAWAQTDDEPETPILTRGEGSIVVGRQRAPLPWAESSFGPLVALAPVVEMLGGTLEVGPLGQAHTLRIAGRELVLGPLGRVVLVDGELHTLSIKPWLEPEPRFREQPRTPADPKRGPARTGEPPWHLYVPIDALARAYPAEQGYRFDFDRRRKRLEVSRTGERRLAVEVDRVHDLGATTLVVTFSDRPRYRVDEYRGGVRLRLLSGVMRPRPRVRLNDPLARWLEVRERSIDIGLAPRAKASEPYILGRPPRVQLVMDITRDRIGRTPPALSRRDEDTDEFRIVLDPGHGGTDTGVSLPSGVGEKDLVLAIAQELRTHLADSLGARVVLTRTDDSDVTIEHRTAAANQRRADLFLSLHLMSPGAARAPGDRFRTYVLDPPPARFLAAAEHAADSEPAEDGEWGEPIGEDDADAAEFPDDELSGAADQATRADADASRRTPDAPEEDDPVHPGGDPNGHPGNDPSDDLEAGPEEEERPVAVPALEEWERVQDDQLERSGLLARLIQSHVSDALDQPNRRVGRAPLRVLTGASMPAVLIELGALGDGEEDGRDGTTLLDESYREVLIEAIGRAIRLYRVVAAGPARNQERVQRLSGRRHPGARLAADGAGP